MKPIKLLLLFTSFLVLMGCASKRMVNKAIELEKQGLYHEAAEYYYKALRKKRDNIDAKVGLKRNGQKVLDDHLANFYKSYNLKDHKAATYHYIDAQKYHHKVQAIGIRLAFAEHYQGYFSESKKIYLSEQYDKGKRYFEARNYEQSKPIFQEIVTIDDTFKDSKNLLNISIIEPMYLKGKEYSKNRLHKKAYYEFSRVVTKSPNYKDAEILKQRALKDAQLTIAILPFQSASTKRTHANTLAAKVATDIINQNNKFISVIDRTYIDQIIREQKLNMSGLVNSSGAVKAGKLIGANSIVFGRLGKLNVNRGRRSVKRKAAYIKEQKRVYDEQTQSYQMVNTYTKTEYTEVFQESSISLSINFQLISTETGRVLASEVIEHTLNDHVHYAEYPEGNYRNLVINPNQAQGTMKMHKLFKARKKLRTVDDMVNEACSEASGQITTRIIKYETSR
ncbi:MAG: hypothetical protein GY827_10305 [Cytophagales bacterium]|nr:hypothetical protein [Cytophagales bacterium]